jgi:hypothetical protein
LKKIDFEMFRLKYVRFQNCFDFENYSDLKFIEILKKVHTLLANPYTGWKTGKHDETPKKTVCYRNMEGKEMRGVRASPAASPKRSIKVFEGRRTYFHLNRASQSLFPSGAAQYGVRRLEPVPAPQGRSGRVGQSEKRDEKWRARRIIDTRMTHNRRLTHDTSHRA